MPNYKTNISLSLLSLTIPLASALPSGHDAPNSVAGTVTDLRGAQSTSFTTPHEIKMHKRNLFEHTPEEIQTGNFFKRDQDHGTADKNQDNSDEMRPSLDEHPTMQSTIKEGGGVVGTSGSSNGSSSENGGDRGSSHSSTSSSGITYDEDGNAINVPLGSGDPIYMPFGGIYDVPSPASVLDTYIVMKRAMVFSVATTLAVYWIL